MVHSFIGEKKAQPAAILNNVDESGLHSIYVLDSYNLCVKRYAVFPNGYKFMEKLTFPRPKKTRWAFGLPLGLAILPHSSGDRKDDILVVSDSQRNCLRSMDLNGQRIGGFGKKGDGNNEFQKPCAMTTTDDGALGIADCENERIQFFKRKE